MPPDPNTPEAEAIKVAKHHDVADGFYWFEGTVDMGVEYIGPAEIKDGEMLIIGSHMKFSNDVTRANARGSFYQFDSTAELIAIW